jgi:hypothetical protein
LATENILFLSPFFWFGGAAQQFGDRLLRIVS